MSKRDHTELICDIGELSGLFTDATSLETFFQKIVEMISEHMQSEVCSLYLYYEDTQELVLKATKGLNPRAIGRVRMKLGEGLTGQALKELRPICKANASQNPQYKFFPEIGEEEYESFLAVPILRGQTRIGALVIQNSKKDFFDEYDENVFRAITSQLANTIETAKMLMSLNEEHKIPSAVDLDEIVQNLKFIKGRVGSGGFAKGEVAVLNNNAAIADYSDADNKQYTREEFLNAVTKTEKQLEELQEQIEEKLSDVASLIFTAQILMLKDTAFINSILALIDKGVNPPLAVGKIIKKYVNMFEKLPNVYLQEKKQDVKDMGRRLLENLVGVFNQNHEYKDRIVIAQELLPSDVLKLSSLGVKGIVLLSGGISSHVSILSRSLEIPLIIADVNQLLHLPRNSVIYMDAEQGNLYLNPSEDIHASFEQREQEKKALSLHKASIKEETKTKDGTSIRLLSNINLLCDVKTALEFKSQGVGLYRTEFPFIVRSDFPSEEEQYVIYKKLVEGMPGKEITLRTLDIGGDKILSYYDYGKEKNPFLGMRSIRFSLKHKDIFRQQLRAILRAGVGYNIRIMFPMISSLEEFVEAKEETLLCIDALRKETQSPFRCPPIGIMVELPAVVEIIDDFAKIADFFCIGTNDFIQYMLAIDRTNEKVADFYLPHHPSILRAIQKVVCSAITHNIDVSVCGDMAHDVRYVPYFLGIGIRKFSVNSHYLPKIQNAIENINIKEAKKQAQRLIKESSFQRINELIG